MEEMQPWQQLLLSWQQMNEIPHATTVVVGHVNWDTQVPWKCVQIPLKVTQQLLGSKLCSSSLLRAVQQASRSYISLSMLRTAQKASRSYISLSMLRTAQKASRSYISLSMLRTAQKASRSYISLSMLRTAQKASRSYISSSMLRTVQKASRSYISSSMLRAVQQLAGPTLVPACWKQHNKLVGPTLRGSSLLRTVQLDATRFYITLSLLRMIQYLQSYIYYRLVMNSKACWQEISMSTKYVGCPEVNAKMIS